MNLLWLNCQNLCLLMEIEKHYLEQYSMQLVNINYFFFEKKTYYFFVVFLDPQDELYDLAFDGVGRQRRLNANQLKELRSTGSFTVPSSNDKFNSISFQIDYYYYFKNNNSKTTIIIINFLFNFIFEKKNNSNFFIFFLGTHDDISHVWKVSRTLQCGTNVNRDEFLNS